ncbi:MAG: hypothetical protein LBU70_05075 [Chitinispirillales bacterium]|nr:hypothetical protein [Chitinispirillales bacterium]
MIKTRGFIVRSALIFALAIGFGAFVYADELEESAPSAGATVVDDDIDRLFGTFQPEPTTPVEAAPVRELPPFEGEYKLLISRPIYALFEPETRTQWIAALGELHTYYKISSFPRTHVFTMEQVNSVLPNSRDFTRRFGRQHYIEAARKLGATHLLFQEYQPNRDGRRTNYSMELFWIAENATVVRGTVELHHNDFENGMNSGVQGIAAAMDPGAMTAPGMSVGLWGRDQRVQEGFGNALAQEEQFTSEAAATVYASVERLINRNSGLLGLQYGAALLAGRAENFNRAISHLEIVLSRSGNHPALQLRMAEFMRGAERFPDAMRAAGIAAAVPALNIPANIEVAMIHQAQGDLERAFSTYNTILESGNADGRVFFQLAVLSIQRNRIADSEGYLSRAEQSGFVLDDEQLFEIGSAYAAIPGQETRAIEMLMRSMGARQANEAAWRIIAGIHERTGNEQARADAYVNMFRISMHGNSGRLKTAGGIYERLGMSDKAKDAYSLFLDRRFSDTEVSISYARLLFNEGERGCRRIPDVLRGLDTIPEAEELFNLCGIEIRRIREDQTLAAMKLSPLMLTLRITGGVVAAGGLAGGLFMNSRAESLNEEYRDWDGEVMLDGTNRAQTLDGVRELRDDINAAVFWRNALYAMSVAGLTGVALTFFF